MKKEINFNTITPNQELERLGIKTDKKEINGNNYKTTFLHINGKIIERPKRPEYIYAILKKHNIESQYFYQYAKNYKKI